MRLTISPMLSVFDVGVTVTRATTADTVTVAAATSPPALTLMFVVPAPTPVADTDEPVVALRLAIDAFTVLHVNVTPDINAFDASNACAVKHVEAPIDMLGFVGLMVTRAIAGAPATVPDTSDDSALCAPPVLNARTAKKYS